MRHYIGQRPCPEDDHRLCSYARRSRAWRSRTLSSENSRNRSSRSAPTARKVRVCVLRVEEEGTFAGAEEGRVATGNNDPVPVSRLEVDNERIAAATWLGAMLVAFQVDCPLWPRRTLIFDVNHQVRLLSLYFKYRNIIMTPQTIINPLLFLQVQ